MDLVIDLQVEAEAADEVVKNLELTQAPQEFVRQAMDRAAHLHEEASLQHIQRPLAEPEARAQA